MATGRKVSAPSNNQEKLTIVERLGVIHIERVSFKQNSNKKDFISTPHGAVYSRINEVKPGLHVVVKLSNNMLALNTAQKPDIMQFLTEQREKSGWSIADLRDFYGV